MEIAVQVNGKIKARLNVPIDADKETMLSLAKANERVQAAIADMTVLKEIAVPKKLVNLVVKPK